VTVGATLGVTRTSAAHLNSGTINLTGGSLTFDQGGASPSVTNSGTITLGTARTLTCDAGAFTNTAGGTLQGSGTLAVGGASAGSGYDRLAVSGAVTLDGALQLALINGFIPAGGSAFNVILWGSHTGDFTSVTGLNPLPEVVLAADPAGPARRHGAHLCRPDADVGRADTHRHRADRARRRQRSVRRREQPADRLRRSRGRRRAERRAHPVNTNGLGGTPTWVALSPTGSPAARQATARCTTPRTTA
jgi:hypothetical protein